MSDGCYKGEVEGQTASPKADVNYLILRVKLSNIFLFRIQRLEGFEWQRAGDQTMRQLLSNYTQSSRQLQPKK